MMTKRPRLKLWKIRHRRRNRVSLEIAGYGPLKVGAIEASSRVRQPLQSFHSRPTRMNFLIPPKRHRRALPNQRARQ